MDLRPQTQLSLTFFASDATLCLSYTSNTSLVQRIESWWAQLRNSVTDWWINLFKVG